MTKKINIGVIGYAAIAERYVIPTIIELNGLFNLTGVASRSPTTANEFSLRFNKKGVVGYETLLEDESLDAVYIPLPNSLHAEWIEKALARNLHVLVEKSMACNSETVEKLNLYAKSKQLILIENFQFRFHRQLSFIKQVVLEGKIGDLRCLRSSFGFPPFSDKNNIRYQKELGGGALLDAGAYTIKIAQEFLGTKLSVEAADMLIDESLGVDIAGGAFLKQRDGNLFSEIAYGFDHFYQCNLELWGSKGKIYTNRIFTAPPGFATEVVLETNTGKEMINLPPDHHFKNMLIHFYNMILSKIGMEEEYNQNINQSRLLAELKTKANE